MTTITNGTVTREVSDLEWSLSKGAPGTFSDWRETADAPPSEVLAELKKRQGNKRQATTADAPPSEVVADAQNNEEDEVPTDEQAD